MDEKLETFYELYERRKSIREFLDKEIEKDKLERLIEALRRAQSAANRQPWHFIIIEKQDVKKLYEVFTKEGFKTAPLIIAACAEPQSAWLRKADGKNYAWVDVTIAITEMIGAATAEGLGTCWIAAIEPAKVREILGIPVNIEVVALIAVGYPKSPLVKEEKNRKPLEGIIHYGKW
ncbi:MAG: nitroreductase family protein [Deltaproteobacteria bacterium]|nr:nitroreductase family protein [Deltaproteobacteria bacterium]MBI3754884.1 nitroreductase family protein [Deltaproteobacteria bacterium]